MDFTKDHSKEQKQPQKQWAEKQTEIVPNYSTDQEKTCPLESSAIECKPPSAIL